MKSRIWGLVAAGVLLMGVGMLGAPALQQSTASPATGGFDVIAATAKTADGSVAPADIDAMQGAIEGSRFSWWANGTGAVGTDKRSTQADVYAVTGAFRDFHRVDMLHGSFLPRTGSQAAAVLSSDLAFRLFGTEDAVGLEVEFQGRTFEVCGVCRPDESLVGLMSGNGLYRAYVSGGDLVASGTLHVAGFEAMAPRGAPGQSLSAVKAAMQGEDIPAGGFLLEDVTERQRLDGELARLPMALFWLTAALVLLAFVVDAAKRLLRGTVSILRSDYFRNVWLRAAWQLGRLLLAVAAGAGLCLVLWNAAGIDFYLPSKYIPGSWIDLTFYKGLIASESQAAIAAQAYPKPWWDLAYGAALRVSAALGALSVLGLAIAALSLRVLRAERRAAGEDAGRVLEDMALLWLLAAAAFGATMGFTAIAGAPLYTAFGGIVALLAGLTAWTVALHRGELAALLAGKAGAQEAAAVDRTVHARQRAY